MVRLMGINQSINFGLSYFNGCYFSMAINNPLPMYKLVFHGHYIKYSFNMLFDGHYLKNCFDGHYYNCVNNIYGLFDGH